jgi:hypothetical protein
MDDGAPIEPEDWDLAAQATPGFEVDQRICWRLSNVAILTRCGMALRPVHATHRKSLS